MNMTPVKKTQPQSFFYFQLRNYFEARRLVSFTVSPVSLPSYQF